MSPLQDSSKENIIGIMTNAIAWEMIDPIDVDKDGVQTITAEEAARCKRAAERAYRQAIEGIE